ncbi:hypothetical protein [Streptomyces sp. NPDC001410]|uniref:hypothetical protein n=1 Tax=Streptomyces sp. NPDC001410 TaxID=3364574 RepID=UPI00367D6FCA
MLCGALLGFAVSDALVALSSYALTFAARLLADAMGGTLWAMLVGHAVRGRRSQRCAGTPSGRTARCAAAREPGGCVTLGALGLRRRGSCCEEVRAPW